MMLVWVLVLTALLASDVAGATEETRVLEKGPCENDWYVFRDRNVCYRFYSDKKTWEDAQAYCKGLSHSPKLASVTSCKNNNFIWQVIDVVEKGNQDAWIGLKTQDGKCSWIDGSQCDYENWNLDEPDNKQGVDCGTLRLDGFWKGVRCDKVYGFVCSYTLH